MQELSYDGRLRKDSWCYLNYIETPKTVIIPEISKDLDCSNDKAAVNAFSRVFPNKEIIQVYANPLVKHGGAIHCITWELYNDKLTITMPRPMQKPTLQSHYKYYKL